MNSALPFAQQMLTTHGEFYPIGMAMRPSGEIVSIGTYDGDERPQSVDVITLLKKTFVAAARKGEYLATVIVYDTKIKLPSTNEKSDAITVSLDHRDDYSVVVFFPYRIDNGEFILGTAFAQKGKA